MRIIRYAVESGTGLVWSRVGGEVALPVLDYDNMTPENNFKPTYHLEKLDTGYAIIPWRQLKWTKKIPTELKNRHRSFWGFKPLRMLNGK
jgi:hypothetical protein